jgi:PAS domain S-box-containing protein
MVLVMDRKETSFESHRNFNLVNDSAKSAEFLESILKCTVAHSLIIITLDGKVLLWNEGAVQNYGYTSEEAITLLNVTDLHTKEDNESGAVKNFHLQALSNGKAEREFIRVRKDGTQFIAAVSLTLRKEGENPSGFILISKDITEKKYIDEQLKKMNIELQLKNQDIMEANRKKSEFLAAMSHELRTPLTSIRGSLGLVLSKTCGEINEQTQKLIAIAQRNCERLTILINDILDIEKIEAGKMNFILKIYFIEDLISQAVELNKPYADQFNIVIKINKPLYNSEVHVDCDRLLQVFANLLSNAIKFSSPGQEITITTEDAGYYIRVSIIDEGEGIAEEFKPYIFERFSQADSSSTRKISGAGLGLNICKAIIERLGGKIGFKSNLKMGTTFYFEIPKIPTIQIKTESMHPRFLVCENNPDIAHKLKKIIEAQGYQVDISYNATQAKSMLKKFKYASLSLDLILPDANGVEFIRELRGDFNTVNLPIIIISVKSQEDDIELKGFAIEVVDWITKPIDYIRLQTAVSKLKPNKIQSTILYIEDDTDLINVISLALSDTAKVIQATTLALAKQLLKEEIIDLILLDVSLPDGSGLEILDEMRDNPKPVIILSGSEVTEEINKKVAATLIKSRASEQSILSTIKRVLAQTEGRFLGVKT